MRRFASVIADSIRQVAWCDYRYLSIIHDLAGNDSRGETKS